MLLRLGKKEKYLYIDEKYPNELRKVIYEEEETIFGKIFLNKEVGIYCTVRKMVCNRSKNNFFNRNKGKVRLSLHKWMDALLTDHT